MQKNLPQLQDLPDIGPLNKNGAAAASPAPSQQIYLQQPKQDAQINYDPFKEQQNTYQQQQPQQILLPQQQHQIVLQHVPQPVQKLIFPQPNVYSSFEVNQQPKQLLLQQPDLAILDRQQVKTEQEQTKLVFPQPTVAPLHQQLLLQQPDIQQERKLPDCDHQQFGLRLNGRRPNKLIDTTQNLVTGQDVLDINNSVSNYQVTVTTAGSTITDFQGTESTEPSLGTQPIIAAEIDENKVHYSSTEQYTDEQIVSSTPGTIQSAEPTPTIVVTPRPSDTTYLDSTVVTEQLDNLNKQNVQVELQKTVPYYLGKYEYPISQEQQNNGTVIEQKINEDIELGKTLLYFPGQQLPHQAVQNNFLQADQGYHYPPPKESLYKEVPQQVYQHQIYHNQVSHKELPNQGYPIKVPYPVIKQLAVPVTVEKVIEKPVHITEIVEKPVPVPQPYPVEKIVEKPVHVPVQVTKYVDRPYPVQVQVPVPQPYPVHVDRIVEKKVHVPQYIDRPYPVQVQVPYAVPVDRIVEKKVPIDRIIEKKVPVPYPVKVEVPVPQPYYIKVEVPRPYHVQLPTKYIEKPYYTLGVVKYQGTNYGNIGTHYQQANYADVIQNIQQGYQHINYQEKQPYLIASNDGTNKGTADEQGYHYPNPYSYAPQSNGYLPPKEEPALNKGYLPPGGRNCDDGYHQGLLPPKSDNPVKILGKFRTARSNFNEKTVKMEYGFRPPMVPSLEIDEFGRPVEK
ncbi:unnamed protein product [Phyllotreta striolata]|uniref:Uncharacterized protein n=1 Tax=Phyllotreta striolata TaxID=444603 RepID=A0A9N9XW62_PHYSR|nr:unnamed protein product [Phyllotreta striolata]